CLGRICRHLCLRTLLPLAAVVAVAMCVKFSAILMFPMMLLCLGTRAMVNQDWSTPFGTLRNRLRRMLAVGGIVTFVALVGWGTIWLCYGLREAPDPVDGAR